MLIKWTRIIAKVQWNVYLFFYVCLLYLSACNEDQKEGCLDYRYANFSVNADINCLDCCRFPELRVTLRHRISQGDSLYPVTYRNQYYAIASGDSFSIENLSFILSDFHLVDLEGKEVPVFDSLYIRTVNPQRDSVFYAFSNSFIIGNPNLFQKKKVAAVFHNGLGVKALRFTLGVKPPANVLTPPEFPANHPLVVNQSYLYQKEKGYIFANMQLKRREFPLDSMTNISLSGSDFLKTIEVPVFTKVKAGYHQEMTLEVDYALWLKGLDFSKDSPEIIRKKWIDNLVNSFKIVTVLEVID
jgi:hypothetical protein